MVVWPLLLTRRRDRRDALTSGRVAATVLLALQALLWGAGSIVEARAAAETFTRVAHVEDTGNPTCPPIHSHLDCLVCRAYSGGALGGHSPTIGLASRGSVDRPLGAIDYTTGLRHGPLGSRAPPGA